MAFKFNIVKPVCVISERNNNGEIWTKELNVVSWNHREPKLDIREWNSDHTRMGKGITLTDEEAEQLCTALHNFVSERR